MNSKSSTAFLRARQLVGASLLVMTAVAHAACPPLLQLKLARLQDDAQVDLCQYAGKVVLVVNTASYCGFTPQYKGLQQIAQRLGPRGLVVLGFPSNDFHQEMKDASKIASFCSSTFGVGFPMFAPSHVTLPDANPLYQRLIRATGKQPRWNFYKYLIDRQGHVAEVDSSFTAPDDQAFLKRVQVLLDAPSPTEEKR